MDGEEKSCDKMSKRQSSKLRRAKMWRVSMIQVAWFKMDKKHGLIR
jgi:hypothetical protein